MPDGTTGTSVAVTGPSNFEITDGTRVGTNLFHSFVRFNIFEGESATFTGSPAIANVISRVTGGEISFINGLLRSDILGADFYFLNRAGVVFGGNAIIDVPGSFHVSTSDDLRFSDGSRFSTTTPIEASTLTSAPPEGFGFLGDQTARIIVQGRLTLEPQPPESPATRLVLSGGAVDIDRAEIMIERGEVHLVPTGDVITVVSNDGEVSNPVQGDLNIIDSSIDVSGDGAGRISIRGGKITMNFSQISSDNRGPIDPGPLPAIDIQASSLEIASSAITTISTEGGQAPNVSVTVANDLSIVNGFIDNGTRGAGNGGTVTMNAGQLLIDRGIIFSVANESATGNAGSVNLNVANDLSIVNGFIDNGTRGAGNGGTVTMNAGQLLIDQGIIFSNATSGATGNAGNVKLNVTNDLSILNGGRINTNTSGAAGGGSVTVQAAQIFIDKQGSEFFTGISSAADVGSLGQTGNITLDTQNLSIANGGTISSESFPTVAAATLANLQPTEINITAQNITLTDSSITTESFGNVTAGSITLLVADTLSLDPSIISTAANNANGGAITTQAKVIDLQDSQITTSVTGQGDGGDINLNANVLVLDTGFIQANTAGANARGGNVQINAGSLITSQDILRSGGNTPLTFQPGLNVIQAAAPDGVSGDINITSPQLNISGDLIDLEAALLDIDKLAQNPCATPGGRQSRLANRISQHAQWRV